MLGYIYNNKHSTYGVHTSNSEWVINGGNNFTTTLTTEGYTLAEGYDYKINSITTSYLNDLDEEVEVTISNQALIDTMFTVQSGVLTGNYTAIYNYFNELGTIIPAYFKLHVSVIIILSGTKNPDFDDVIGIVVDNKDVPEAVATKQKNAFLRNGFYVHGRAGIFNEMDYEDAGFDNQILPTKWYEKQEPFEFEFVVNDDIGLHKIFDNLVIISNNVQPEEIQYEIVGDVYNFNKSGIFRNQKFNEDIWNKNRRSTKPGIIVPDKPIDSSAQINPTDWPNSKFRGDLDKPRVALPKKYKSTQELLNAYII